MAPFEGIYINESIVGLIKVLSKNILQKDDHFILDKLMKEQEQFLNFKTQKTNIRNINKKLYTDTYTSHTQTQYENIFRDNDQLKELSKINKETYSSQKIFNYEHPTIESIINIYVNPRILELSDGTSINIEPVSDFKMFYLFSNNAMEKKCPHQLKLLQNTISFIEAINAD
jgi:protein tyrosine/serine phosphatase